MLTFILEIHILSMVNKKDQQRRMKNMKYYSFDALVRRNKKIHKSFHTREKANQYLDKFLERYNTEVMQINQSNHDIDYICTNNAKISINRHIVA